MMFEKNSLNSCKKSDLCKFSFEKVKNYLVLTYEDEDGLILRNIKNLFL